MKRHGTRFVPSMGNIENACTRRSSVRAKKLLYVKCRKMKMNSFKISIKKNKTSMFTVLGTNLYIGTKL